MENSHLLAKEKIQKFFVDEFGISMVDQIWSLSRGVSPWDSLKHIELINAFEVRFSIELSFDESCSLTKAEDFIRVLESR